MLEVVRFDSLSKSFGNNTALRDLTFSMAPSRIVGLVGTNGSGKSTLLRHIVGLYLPTKGECYTFGTPARKLGTAQLARIGMVHQQEDLFLWMSVREMLAYIGSFYDGWDRNMQQRLVEQFELDARATVGHMAPGNRQRLAIILAICHRPDLVLLDEPLSALDPLAREQTLRTILDVFRDYGPTIVVSSHLLQDIERVIDHVICLDAGKLLLNEPLDRLKERFAEWTLTGTNDRLPRQFTEPWIVSQTGTSSRVVVVSDAAAQLPGFMSKYGVAVESRPINLERIFTSLVRPLHSTENRAGQRSAAASQR
jgi:ABC-2 type transport system ATP-binding protein